MASKADTKRAVGVALCGFGRAGQIHFSGLRRNYDCKLKYIVDRTDLPEVLETITNTLDKYHIKDVRPVSVEDFDKVVLKDDEIEAVVVATPTDSHEYYVRKALEAKRGVFCEKPLAGNIKDVTFLYDLAEKVERPLYCAFNRRFDPGMRNVHDQVRDGSVGKIYQIKTCSRDSSLPTVAYLKISSGMFHDCAVHDIDMVCWIIGEEPIRVTAEGSAFDKDIRDLDDVDTVAILMKFPSGVLATIDLCRHSSYGYDQRLEVLGEKGMLRVENISRDSVEKSSSEGISNKPLLFSFPQRYQQAYQLEIDHFISLILDPSIPPCVTRKQTILSSRIAEACELSCREGGKPVELAVTD